MMKKKIGLYMHIPFCKAKCHYCDFNSKPGMEDFAPAYFGALYNEMSLYSDRRDLSVKTVFIGGGTPSLVPPEHITNLLDNAHESFDIQNEAEISIESNPGTLDSHKLEAYLKAGVNRISIGLQAWQDSLLRTLGRIHSSRQFAENFLEARRAGFKNINVDLIFGLPGQTPGQWEETLDRVIELSPQHISCYDLKIEEGTEFDRLQKQGLLPEPDDGLDREMYYAAIEKLAQAGFEHYEISNFARPGYRCRHNLIYWEAQEYVGLGAGAHSYLDGQRYANITDIRQYAWKQERKESTVEDRYIIEPGEAMSEYMILKLRLIEGISGSDFRRRFNCELRDVYGEQLEKLEKKGLLQQEPDGIKLTAKGLDFANQVFIEFI